MPFSSKHNESSGGKTVKEPNNSLDGLTVEQSLDKNIATLRNLFADVDVLVVRTIENDEDTNLKFCIVYLEGMVDDIVVNDNIVKPLMITKQTQNNEISAEMLIHHVVSVNDARKMTQFSDIVESITCGYTILFADGQQEAVTLSTQGFETRSVTEPENEKIINGPREGFTENAIKNLSMIVRKLHTNELKIKYLTMGEISKTRVCVCYIDSVVNKGILQELYKRLNNIKMDAVLETNYLVEQIADDPLSLFRSSGVTERPDVVAGKLLEGRIAVFVDGSPMVMTVPYLFIENFQSSEDYYLSFYYTSFTRLLRIIGFFLTITVAGFYIAVVAYDQEMLPTPLLISIAAERANVPLPAAVEAFIMLLVFDLLRETGVRMPTGIGQTLSIVGALVIGQAAVDAKLVAAPMIIVVGVTGITSLLVPKLESSAIYLRFFLLIISTSFGLFGFILGVSSLLIYVLNLTSMGIPQFTTLDSLKYQELKDVAIRGPWKDMVTRSLKLTKNWKRKKTHSGGR